MFSQFPQKLSTSFGLLTESVKLSFRTQPDGLLKLATVRNISETDTYWNQYITLFDSASEVFSLITPHDIRRALLDAPENIATLIRVICKRLFNLISDHTFPSASNASVSAFASSLMKSTAGSGDRNTTKEVLNCLRVLTRVLPVVFEVEGEESAFELEVLWKKEEPQEEETVPQAVEASQFVIEDEDDSDNENEEGDPTTSASASSPPTPSKPKKEGPSLADKLFSSIIDLMFCCGFTLPRKLQKDHYKINYIIWEKGVGSTSDTGPNHQYDSNKVEVLRLLLVLLSRQIYIPPSSLFSKPSLYTLHLVQKIPRRDVLTILCSLLNTAIHSSTQLSIGSVAGKLPYNHLVFKGEDHHTSLVGICHQVLIVLLDFQSGSARDNVVGNPENQTWAPTSHTNAFRYFLMKLHRVQDFSFILDGILGILEQQISIMSNPLPGARKDLPHVAETVLLLWKILDLNKKFRLYVLDSDKAMDLVACLLCYNLEIKDKPQQHGLCRALSYILQTLSAEPSFGSKLTGPIKIQLPSKYNTIGTAADFLISSIYSMVTTTSGSLNSLYPALIITLSNCAPYFRNLNITSSARLIQLFTSFSNPTFLLSDEGNPRLLFFMLEAFNSIILHQMTHNTNIIYAILGAHKTFEDLGTFTLASGLREVRRKEEARKAAKTGSARSSAELPGSSSEEKARLLSNERDIELNEVGSTTQAESPVVSSDTSVAEPPLSPTAETVTTGPASEKARGKMKERRSLSEDMNRSFERLAVGIGRNGFVPTQEWVTSWQQGLPLDTVMLLISELLPKVQEMQSSRKLNSTTAILDFLANVDLTGILPPAPEPSPRRFLWSDASIIWLTSLIWGEIFVRGMTPLGIWNSTNVRLFYVKHSQNQQRQITEAVSNVVGGFLGRTNSDSNTSRSRG